jgi:molybdopterin biosynthesis enzyme
MTKTRKALRSDAYSPPIELSQVDGIALSAEEVNLAKLLVDKLERKGSVIDFSRASKRRLTHSRARNFSR